MGLSHSGKINWMFFSLLYGHWRNRMIHDDIRKAYRQLGKGAFYDGMITCSTLLGKVVCRIVWGMGSEENGRYLGLAMEGVPEHFDGDLLEVPVGTGILTMPLYRKLRSARIQCLDYSDNMLTKAKTRARDMSLSNVVFFQGDVGSLPFDNESFDVVLSLNGFHAFPDKDSAYRETHRVLKRGGVFCGCQYVQGECRRTDWLVSHVYGPKSYFTPPYETVESLRCRLNDMYGYVSLDTVKAIACFRCRK